jgi:hypothetical protein
MAYNDFDKVLKTFKPLGQKGGTNKPGFIEGFFGADLTGASKAGKSAKTSPIGQRNKAQKSKSRSQGKVTRKKPLKPQ